MFKGYFISKIKSIILFIIFTGIFYTVLYLFELPVLAVGYASLLCGTIGAVFLVIDFILFYQKNKKLVIIRKHIDELIDEIPTTFNLTERNYQELIKVLNSEKQRIQNELSGNYSELVDYYTLWVHQIKTPIAAIDLILQGENNDLSKEIQFQLKRIEQYVEMVLCYLRLDSEDSDYVLKEYDIDSIIKQGIRKYAPQFIRKKITLKYSESNVKVITDEKWLLFVIEQILSNALKYTQSGSISVSIKDNRSLVIEDTGIGIDKSDLPRVFQKGYTGYNGRAKKKSTGIGLYLCKRILDKIGHSIKIESTVGKGTKVIINLTKM